MNHAINTLRAQGIPLDSATKAIRHIKEDMGDANQAAYLKKLQELVGSSVKEEGYNKTRLTYLYLVSLLVDYQKNSKDGVTINELYSMAGQKAVGYIAKNPWISIYEGGVVEATDGNGLHTRTAIKRTKRNAGGKSKLELARESFQKHSQLRGKALNEAVAKDVGTTVKGANSLVYMVRKELKAAAK